ATRARRAADRTFGRDWRGSLPQAAAFTATPDAKLALRQIFACLHFLPMAPLRDPRLKPLPRLLFLSRWLQVPLYLGLIIAQGVYVYYCMVELLHLVEAAMGSQTALETILRNATPVGADTIKAPPETLVMLVV